MHSSGISFIAERAEEQTKGGICHGSTHNPGCISPLAIGLIIAGAVVALALITAVLFFFQRRRRARIAAAAKNSGTSAERGFHASRGASTDELMSETNQDLSLSISTSRTTMNTLSDSSHTVTSSNTSSSTMLPLSRTTTGGSKLNIVIPVINRGVSEPRPGEFVYRPRPPNISPLNALPQLLRYQKNEEVVVDNRPGAESDSDSEDEEEDRLGIQADNGRDRPPSYGHQF